MEFEMSTHDQHVNRWMIGRGKGHAVVHQYHH